MSDTYAEPSAMGVISEKCAWVKVTGAWGSFAVFSLHAEVNMQLIRTNTESGSGGIGVVIGGSGFDAIRPSKCGV